MKKLSIFILLSLIFSSAIFANEVNEKELQNAGNETIEFINYTALNGTYDNETGIWTIGFMENGTSTTLTILSRAIQSKENITNVANVSCDEVEWDYTNNIDNATINLYPNINKTVNPTANVNGNFYTQLFKE